MFSYFLGSPEERGQKQLWMKPAGGARQGVCEACARQHLDGRLQNVDPRPGHQYEAGDDRGPEIVEVVARHRLEGVVRADVAWAWL